jgi:hypothetical protein
MELSTTLILTGVSIGLYVVNNYFVINKTIRTIINALVIALVCMFMLEALGVVSAYHLWHLNR